MDIIFKIGLFFIPFENLFIAPSSGWATITPIIFLIYTLFNFKYTLKSLQKYKHILIFFIIAIILSTINYLIVGIETINLVNALISLGLGMVNLISIDIYFRQKKNSIEEIVKILLVVYGISLLIGLIQFITVKLDIEIIKQFFIMIEKRSYIRYDRVQFTFTEPSFIGMHLFGILLPIYFLTKNKKILALIITFALSAIIFSSGVRILIDIVIVATICYAIFFIKNIRNKKVIISTFLIVIVGIVGCYYIYNHNDRIKQIVNNGIYADGSLASRFFRINASIKGYTKKPAHFLYGYRIRKLYNTTKGRI